MPVIGDSLHFIVAFYDLDGFISDVTIVDAKIYDVDGSVLVSNPTFVQEVSGAYGYTMPGITNDVPGEYLAVVTCSDVDKTPPQAITSIWVDDLASGLTDPWATILPGSGYPVGSAAYEILAILAKTNTIGAGALTVVSPVINAQTIRFVQADDYFAADGRSWDFIYSGLPSFAGGTEVTLRITSQHRPQETLIEITGAALNATTLRFEPTSVETGIDTIDLGKQRSANFAFETSIKLANNHVITPTPLDHGLAIIEAQAP